MLIMYSLVRSQVKKVLFIKMLLRLKQTMERLVKFPAHTQIILWTSQKYQRQFSYWHGYPDSKIWRTFGRWLTIFCLWGWWASGCRKWIYLFAYAQPDGSLLISGPVSNMSVSDNTSDIAPFSDSTEYSDIVDAYNNQVDSGRTRFTSSYEAK